MGLRHPPSLGTEMVRRKAGKETQTHPCDPGSRSPRQVAPPNAGPRGTDRHCARALRPSWRHASTSRAPATFVAPRPPLPKFRFPAGRRSWEMPASLPTAYLTTEAASRRSSFGPAPSGGGGVWGGANLSGGLRPLGPGPPKLSRAPGQKLASGSG